MNKDIKRKLKKFTRFLKENNCYNEYFNNCNNFFIDFVFFDTLKWNYDKLFINSFNWGNSKEGFKYWDKISTKWNYINWEEL